MGKNDPGIQGCYYFIELEINPKHAVYDYGDRAERNQKFGAYASPGKVHEDFFKIVTLVNSKFPGSYVVYGEDVENDVAETAVILDQDDDWLSRVRISCVDHRNETKH